jgi:hypothetical protein
MLWHTLAQNLPFKIGEKYTKIYESTAGKIVDTFSMKEGFADFKSGITDMKDGLVWGEGTDANRAAIEQAKIDQKMQQEQHAHDLKIKEVEHKQAMESKKADLKADLTKTKMQDRKETREARNERRHKRREGRKERRHERRKTRTENSTKKAELENDLYKHKDTEATKRHEADQTLAGTRNTNDVTKYQAKQNRLTEENKHQQTLTQQAADDAKQAAKEAADQAKETADKAAKDAAEDAGYAAMITKANSFVRGAITDPDTQISQAETLRNNLATIPAGPRRWDADSAETALNNFIKNCQKDKEDKKAAKENLSITDNISKAELFAKGAITRSITDLNKKIGTAESLRNNLPTLPTGHTEETRLKGVIDDLNTFIETCQASIDKENVDNAIKPSSQLRNKYMTWGVLDTSKITTVKECQDIVDEARRVQSKLINPNSISTIIESNRIKQEETELEDFINEIEKHKSTMPSSTPEFKKNNQLNNLNELCDKLKFNISENTKYTIIISDKDWNEVHTEGPKDSWSDTTVNIDLSGSPLKAWEYTVTYKTSNAFWNNNNDNWFKIEVKAKPISTPTVTDNVDPRQKIAIVTLDSLDTNEELLVTVTDKKWTKLITSEPIPLGAPAKDITINNLLQWTHNYTITLVDKNNPKRTLIINHPITLS